MIETEVRAAVVAAHGRPDPEEVEYVTAAPAVPGVSAGSGPGPEVEVADLPGDPRGGRRGGCEDLLR